MDINIDLDYFTHPKTTRLVGILGRGSEAFPIKLWCHLAKHHARDGKMIGYSPKEIESIIGWSGTHGEALNALVKIGFVEKCKGVEGYQAHDWNKHQGHLWVIKKRNKKVAVNRWKNIGEIQQSTQFTVDTRNVPVVYQKPISGVPYTVLPSLSKESKESKDKDTKSPPPPPTPGPQNQGARTASPPAPFPGAQAKTQPQNPKPTRTPVQRVVRGFKAALEVCPDDLDWDAVYFPRYAKSAKALLTLFHGDLDQIAACIEAVSGEMNKAKLSWTPETIVKHASAWREGKLLR